MTPGSFVLLGSTVTPLHIERDVYSLLEWRTPANAAKPPPHRHRHTDEGFYVARGRLATQIDGEQAVHEEGSFIQIRRGRWHTFWNPGDHPATYVVTITPQGLERYFTELAAGLAATTSPAEAQALREELVTRYDVEMHRRGRRGSH
jgi:mannose-6-phosphate isomerase-like protein (cupin superfamily)